MTPGCVAPWPARFVPAGAVYRQLLQQINKDVKFLRLEFTTMRFPVRTRRA